MNLPLVAVLLVMDRAEGVPALTPMPQAIQLVPVSEDELIATVDNASKRDKDAMNKFK